MARTRLTSPAILLGVALMVTPSMAAQLEIGDPAPAVQTVDHDGKPLNLGDAYARGMTLVYFYPKADTPGCTKQACSIRDGYAKLREAGIQVFGVSHDTVKEQKAFRDKNKLPFTLVADTDRKVSAAFGVPSRGEYAARQAFLIKDGKIVWRDFDASTTEQAADVLRAVEDMKGGEER